MRSVSDASHMSPDVTTAGFLPPFEVQVTCGPLAVRRALDMVFDLLTPLALDVEEKSTVELVLAEALNNIVEHAYPPPDMTGPIQVSIRHCKDGLHVRLRDRGRAMPDDKRQSGKPDPCEIDLADLPEGGFGWFLIQDLSRDVEYARIDGQNHLSLRIAVAFRQ